MRRARSARRFPEQPTPRLTARGAFGRTQFHVHRFQPPADALQIIALMPQWDFLNSSPKHGERLPKFSSALRNEAVD